MKSSIKACNLAILFLIATAAANAVDLRQFVVTLRVPDQVAIITETNTLDLKPGPVGLFTNSTIRLNLRADRDGVHVIIASPATEPKQIRLSWRAAPDSAWKYMGGAWERGYGDLEWRTLDEKRAMPWYFLANDGRLTYGCGVKTGPSALCSWFVTSSNIVLQADVRSGGVGLRLGTRLLDVCTITCRPGILGETPFQAAQGFCRVLCPMPRLPGQPIYGLDDWLYSNGNDTAEKISAEVSYLGMLTTGFANRPFAVIDAGWQAGADADPTGPGPWDRPNRRFSSTVSMPQLAGTIRSMGVRPGIWCRPLIASPNHPQRWRLVRDPKYLDPSLPEVRAYVRGMMAQFQGWGFELIKHDFSTFDITGQLGRDMGENVTPDGWAFADRSRTTAEIIKDLYRDIRAGAGSRTLVMGCNTMGHLAAGYFELQQTSDDANGVEWEHTRKMGVNSLAFCAPQHGTFYAIVAGLVGQNPADSIPWASNRQWLKLLARSGTPLFISFSHLSVGSEQEDALRVAFTEASSQQPLVQPLDWMDQRVPMLWRLGAEQASFQW